MHKFKIDCQSLSSSKGTLILCLVTGILFLFNACQSGEATKTTIEVTPPSTKKFTQVRLEQVDSIMIDVIGNFGVYDYNAETGLFLAGDIAREYMMYMGGSGPTVNELGHMVINQEGEIVNQFNRTDNGPEGHRSKASDNFFMSKSSIGVINASGLYEYGLDGTFLKRYRGLNTTDSKGNTTFGGFVDADESGMLAMALPKWSHEGDSVDGAPMPLRFYNLKAFETGQEPVEDNIIQMYGFPDHKVYVPDSKFPNSLNPRVSINRVTNKLQVIYPQIPYMEVYDAKTGAFEQNVDLMADHFGDFVETGRIEGGTLGYEGLLWSNRGGKFANSAYRVLVQLGEYSLTMYNTALPAQELKKLINASDKIAKNEEWPSMRRKHYQFYYQLHKNGEKVLPDFRLPEFEPQEGQVEFLRHNKTRGVIIGGDGLDRLYVYIPNDGEEERDYELIRVYKLHLLEE